MKLKCKMQVINLYQCDPGFCTGMRVLSCQYLLYVHSGKGAYQIGDTIYQASMGDIFYCPAGKGHMILADTKEPFLLSGIEFCCDHVKIEKHLLPVGNILFDPFLISVIREMIHEYTYGMTDSEWVCDQLLTTLILRLMRIFQNEEFKRESIVSTILEYIHSHWNQEIPHSELSRKFSYHKNSINRLLISATGMPLKQYQIDLRIKKACTLLAYSEKTIEEIAELCGYSSDTYFCRQFKEKVGITPSEFRRKRL